MSTIYQKPVTSRVTQSWGANAAWYRANVGQAGHNGIDYGSPSGTPVRAIADGTIEFEGWGQNHSLAGSVAGIYCLIKHASHRSGYAHLSSTIVNRNQKVKKGQIIGYTGATGLVSGPHLHFEMFPSGAININNGFYGRVNPLPLLELKAPKPVPKPPAYKWATTTGVAHVRSAPRLNASLRGSKKLAKGARFAYTGVVSGDRVAGNNKWLKSTVGNYVWSGNVKY